MLARTHAFGSAKRNLKGLLPYAIRRAAAQEMFYGGARVQHLVMSPPTVHFTESDRVSLPTPSEEAVIPDLDIENVPLNVLPNNIAFPTTFEQGTLRSKDVLRRFREQNAMTHHVSKEHLSVLVPPWRLRSSRKLGHVEGLPAEASFKGDEFISNERTSLLGTGGPTWKEIRSSMLNKDNKNSTETQFTEEDRSMERSVYGRYHYGLRAKRQDMLQQSVERQAQFEIQQRLYSSSTSTEHQKEKPVEGGAAPPQMQFYFLPYMMYKPMARRELILQRSSSVRAPSAELLQERLNRKGFGWKETGSRMWHLGWNPKGWQPNRLF